MTEKTYNVLFLCTGNSARSVFAEALVNHWSQGGFKGFSAGSFPKGQIHPMTLEVLRSFGLPTEGLRSKGWDEFAKPDSPTMDFVITVCDQAAGEACPIWPGHPINAHWGVEDPAAVQGTEAEKMRAFREAFRILDVRVKLLMNLRARSLDRFALENHVNEIGRAESDLRTDESSK